MDEHKVTITVVMTGGVEKTIDNVTQWGFYTYDETGQPAHWIVKSNTIVKGHSLRYHFLNRNVLYIIVSIVGLDRV